MSALSREEQIALLRDRFVHRSNAYAQQWYNKRKADGGYIKVVAGECPPGSRCPRGGCQHRLPVPITDEVLADHLDGTITIGVYQLGDDDRLRWLCFDIDKEKDADRSSDELHEDAQNVARLVARSCQSLGLAPVVEDSGNRGYHVWVFFSSPTPAAHVRAIGSLIVSMVEVPSGLHVELFPKQVSVKSYGSLVKLPLGVHRKSGRRSHFVDRAFAPVEDPFALLQRIPLTTPEECKRLAETHSLKIESIRRESSSDVDPYSPRCLLSIMSKGVNDGARDIAAFKLGCYLRSKGIPYDLAEEMLMSWDQRYNSPPLGGALIASKTHSAYSEAYSWNPCSEYALDRYCDPGCYLYADKLKRRNRTHAAVLPTALR